MAAIAVATATADPNSNLRIGLPSICPRKPNVSRGLPSQRPAKPDVARVEPERRSGAADDAKGDVRFACGTQLSQCETPVAPAETNMVFEASSHAAFGRGGVSGVRSSQ